MKSYTDEHGTWKKKILDPQIICFKSEIELALRRDGLLHKIESSNSGLRYVLTIFDPKYSDYTIDDKGFYLKTLKRNLQDSINMTKALLPDSPIYVEELLFNAIPSDEEKEFRKWMSKL